MKRLGNLLYVLGAIVLVVGISFVIVAITGEEDFRLPGYILIFTSSAIFIFAFAFDFKNVMIKSATAGDEYVVMSKAALIKEVERRKIEHDKDKNKDYYSTLLRKYDEEAFLKEINKNEEQN